MTGSGDSQRGDGGPRDTAEEQPGSGARPRFRDRPVLLIAALFFAAVTVALAHMRSMQSNLVKTQALQSAKLLSETVAAFRAVYTSEVVERARSGGVEVTHDYLEREGAIPLPATLSMMLGNRIGESETGGETRLYSRYPFPWRSESGGLTDDFAREAWEAVSRNPDEPFYRFEALDGREVLRYASADVMLPACVECHNTHPDTPKDDWQAGDVRGVLEVITPLEIPLATTRAGLRNAAIIMILMAMTGLMLLSVVLRRLQQAGVEALPSPRPRRRDGPPLD